MPTVHIANTRKASIVLILALTGDTPVGVSHPASASYAYRPVGFTGKDYPADPHRQRHCRECACPSSKYRGQQICLGAPEIEAITIPTAM